MLQTLGHLEDPGEKKAMGMQGKCCAGRGKKSTKSVKIKTKKPSF